MKRNGGNAGVRAGLIITVIGLLMTVLPPILAEDPMDWAFAMMVVGFLVFVLGITVWLLYRRRRKVMRRMEDGREALARWTYDKAFWAACQKEEIDSNKGMPIFGAVLGGVFAVIGFFFFLSDPDDMGGMLAIMAGIGALIAFVAWLSSTLRKRAIRKDPGEVVIARGGIYYMGFLTDWNGVTSWFDGAGLEEEGKTLRFVVKYRQLAGRAGHIQSGQVSVPVPPGREEEARMAASLLNSQPY